MEPRISIITLGVSDLERSVTFYREGLGLPTTYRGHRPEEVWAAMGTAKNRQAGRLRFVLPREVGDVILGDKVSREDVLAVLETMREEGG